MGINSLKTTQQAREEIFELLLNPDWNVRVTVNLHLDLEPFVMFYNTIGCYIALANSDPLLYTSDRCYYDIACYEQVSRFYNTYYEQVPAACVTLA